MNKIIVPIDFSLYSENALRTAASVARIHNSELILFNALQLPKDIALVPEKYLNEEADFYHKIAKDQCKEFSKKNYLKGLKVRYVIKRFKIFTELNDLANKENADLIIMGSHGTSGLKEFFIGSNTEKVVRTSDTPVLVVKGLPNTADFKNAIFGCDFSEGSIIPYQKIKKLLASINCDITLLYVNTPNNFLSYKQQVKKAIDFLFKAEGNLDLLDRFSFTSDYTVEEGIIHYAKKYDFDLIITATNGRKGLSHFFKGSISEDVANHAILPVMTIKS